MSIPSCFCCLVLLAVPVWGQDSSPAPAISEEEAQEAEQDAVSASPTDTALETEIRDRFSQSKIAVNEFTVRVNDGVAYIDGETDVAQHKGTATRLARLAGAEQVVNRVEISAVGKRLSRNARRGQPRRVHVRRQPVPRSQPRDESAR